jgi:predicted HTH domain antitoxin
MKQQISINYPESLAHSLKMNNREFESEIKIISLIKLYELGKISSGFAAKVLNISRIEFLELLNKYNVSYFHKGLEDELETDLANA